MAYSESEINEIFDSICEKIENGESLRKIFRDLQNIPTRQTFYNWMAIDQKKIDQYARASTTRADLIFEEILEISDSQGNDKVIIDGIETTNHNAIQRNRLQIDARKWILSKMNPKKYGEKSELDVTSGGEKINQETTVTFINARKKDEL